MESVLHHRRCCVLVTLRNCDGYYYCCRAVVRRYSSILYMVAAVIALALVVVYYIYDPSASVFFPKCPFYILTNLPCAGCGSQRAIHSLLHWEIRQAVEYNLLVVVFIPVLLILSISSLFKSKYPKVYYYLHHSYVAYSVCFIILMWWVLRIILHWYV